MARKMCGFCGKNGQSYANRLCFRCNGNPEARKKFPYPMQGRKLSEFVRRNATVEELDAMIDEQMKNLPPWWWKESEKEDGGDENPQTLRNKPRMVRVFVTKRREFVWI